MRTYIGKEGNIAYFLNDRSVEALNLESLEVEELMKFPRPPKAVSRDEKYFFFVFQKDLFEQYITVIVKDNFLPLGTIRVWFEVPLQKPRFFDVIVIDRNVLVQLDRSLYIYKRFWEGDSGDLFLEEEGELVVFGDDEPIFVFLGEASRDKNSVSLKGYLPQDIKFRRISKAGPWRAILQGRAVSVLVELDEGRNVKVWKLDGKLVSYDWDKRRCAVLTNRGLFLKDESGEVIQMDVSCPYDGDVQVILHGEKVLLFREDKILRPDCTEVFSFEKEGLSKKMVASFRQQGLRILTLDRDKKVRILDIERGKFLGEYSLEREDILYSMDLHPTESIAYLVTTKGEIIRIDYKRKEIKILKPLNFVPFELKIVKDGLLIGTRTGELLLIRNPEEIFSNISPGEELNASVSVKKYKVSAKPIHYLSLWEEKVLSFSVSGRMAIFDLRKNSLIFLTKMGEDVIFPILIGNTVFYAREDKIYKTDIFLKEQDVLSLPANILRLLSLNSNFSVAAILENRRLVIASFLERKVVANYWLPYVPALYEASYIPERDELVTIAKEHGAYFSVYNLKDIGSLEKGVVRLERIKKEGNIFSLFSRGDFLFISLKNGLLKIVGKNSVFSIELGTEILKIIKGQGEDYYAISTDGLIFYLWFDGENFRLIRSWKLEERAMDVLFYRGELFVLTEKGDVLRYKEGTFVKHLSINGALKLMFPNLAISEAQIPEGLLPLLVEGLKDYRFVLLTDRELRPQQMFFAEGPYERFHRWILDEKLKSESILRFQYCKGKFCFITRKGKLLLTELDFPVLMKVKEEWNLDVGSLELVSQGNGLYLYNSQGEIFKLRYPIFPEKRIYLREGDLKVSVPGKFLMSSSL